MTGQGAQTAPATSATEADGHLVNDDFVTVLIADQWFGIPVRLIHDVFSPQAITQVPLAQPEVAGVLNLRGRIVTAIDMRSKLSLPKRDGADGGMAVGIEKHGESYGLIIDQVGEVLSLDADTYERNPANLDPRWRGVSRGVYRLEGSLLVVLDVDRVLEFADAGPMA